MSLAGDETHVLPCGDALRLDRLRSDGILNARELTYCANNDIPVSFDPMQSGWVPAQAVDDLYMNEVRDAAHPRTTRHQANVSLHLHLRAWDKSDVQRFRYLLDDARVWENMPEDYPAPMTTDMASALIDLANASNHHQVHAVLHDGLPVGQVRLLFDGDPQDPGVAEISYWIGHDYWGRGFASAAVSAFVRQCFAENPGLTALIARVKNGNSASLRVLEKAGFVPEGSNDEPDWQVLRKTR